MRETTPAVDALSPQLTDLAALAGHEMMREAMEIARARLGLTAEKLALIIVRSVAPDELLGETEESNLRGCSPTTLRGMKERGDVRRVVNV